MGIELRTPTELFITEAKTWHEDSELNLLTGFGRGASAQSLAQHALDETYENCPEDVRLFAIWDRAIALGYVAFTDLDEYNKTAQLHITIPRQHWGRGVGTEALSAAVDKGMRDGLYRIVFSPLTSNKRAIAAAHNAGFKLEARTKFSAWTVDGPQDQAQMRVVKPEWRKRTR